MFLIKHCFACFFLILFLPGCKHNDPVKTDTGKIQLLAVQVGSAAVNLSGPITVDLPVDQSIVLSFSAAVDVNTVQSSMSIKNGALAVDVDFSFQDNNKKVSIKPKQSLLFNTQYTLVVSNLLKGANREEFPGFQIDFKTVAGTLFVLTFKIGGQAVTGNRVIDIPLDLTIEINFSAPLNTQTVTANSVTVTGPNSGPLVFTFSNENKTLTITRATPLIYLSKYHLNLSTAVQGTGGEVLPGVSTDFYSGVGNHTSGLASKTDDELLTLVQQQTFKYFWDFGHPASGMARERDTSGDLVTTGGSGFGIMAIIVGIERNFNITRTEGIARLNKIVSFLETADRFHGAWPHWMSGTSGTVIPFSTKDNGGDLVETSFLIEGLLTFRQYLQQSSTLSTDTAGNNLINRINTLWQTVEWDWYRNNGLNVLYWHWSPAYDWQMNFPLYGYFEEQITYVLAAASPTHGIPKSVYSNGFGLNGNIVTNQTYYSYLLPLGGLAPLFWVQYSYIGMDPHFSDDYANYWTQNVNASLIDHAYCKANPQHYPGYSDSCWGLTASDNPDGYGAQSPGNDNGTITPTAALSSFPYTPAESMKALRFFYDTLGDRIWGGPNGYGFYDAFNINSTWYANSYLAIDQGPIVGMIENYRTGLLWNLLKSAPEMQTANTTLGFH